MNLYEPFDFNLITKVALKVFLYYMNDLSSEMQITAEKTQN